MISLPSYLTTLAPWEFSVYIAPRDVIQAALPDAAGAFRSVVYLHGNSGTRLLKEHLTGISHMYWFWGLMT